MTIRECYEMMDGNYEDASARLVNDTLLEKFLMKFPDDGSFCGLIKAMEDKNYDEAFRFAHTLKGVAGNLSLTALAEADSEITEALRVGDVRRAEELLPAVREAYVQVCEAVGRMKKDMA